MVNSNFCLIDMKHDFNLTLKMYKVVFSDKPITEIKKKMHIEPIFTYSDSEIALKVCRNKQRFKFNRSPLWLVLARLQYLQQFQNKLPPQISVLIIFPVTYLRSDVSL